MRCAQPQHAVLTLIRTLVVSKVDYCATVLVGVSGRLLDRLQSVLSAAARLIFSAKRSDHISPLLYDLHWLRIPEHIKFWLCSPTFRCLHGTAPSYLADSLRRTAWKADVICGPPLQHLWSFPPLSGPLLATARSQWPQQKRGMNFQRLTVTRRPY